MDPLKAKANFARVCQLLIDKGGEALRLVLLKKILPSTLTAVLNAKKPDLQKLRYSAKKITNRVINDEQWELLYPTSGATADSNKFDITLLTILLRNICVLSPPAKGWHVMPPITDPSLSADILRIKIFRNKVYGHIPRAEYDDPTFETLWKEISKPLVMLGIPQQDIDELKMIHLSPEEKSYIEKLKEWKEQEDVLLEKIRDVEARVSKVEDEVVGIKDEVVKQREFLPPSKVEQLAKFDLSGKINGLCEKFQDGTRKWFFNKLSDWFSDKNRESRAMILTAGPGVGKSVLSAKVCELYKHRGQLIAYHFCDFRNFDYSNPNRILQSLASQMCDNLDGFHDKLAGVLCREHSRDSLSDAFRVLLNDPLHAIDRREPMLIVLDALDESKTDDKSEFLQLISDEFPLLPKWIKILISTRPELQVRETLHHFKPLEIRPDDRDHNLDLGQFIRHHLPNLNECNVDLAIVKCQGSFLYAYYLVEELNEIDLGIEPDLNDYVLKGISGFYDKQFKRLQTGFQSFKQGALNSFINVVAASKDPLPIEILLRCMDLSDEKYELRKAISDIMSEILPVYNDCLTVYHKSLIDWMILDGYEEHAFVADIPHGTERLWRACKSVYSDIDSLESVFAFRLSPGKKFAIENFLKYLFSVGKRDDFDWLVNIGLNIFKLKFYGFPKVDFIHILRNYNDLSGNLSLRIIQLVAVLTIIRRHFRTMKNMQHIYTDDKSHDTMRMLCHIYLQSLANGYFDFAKNRGCKDKARNILVKANEVWVEEVAKVDSSNYKIISSAVSGVNLTATALSPDKKLFVCSFFTGVQLFQLPNLTMTFEIQVSSSPEFLTFSPDSSYFLCSSIRSRVSIRKQKELKEVPFISHGPENIFSCSFSSCGKKLATSEKNFIKLWDVRKKDLLAEIQTQFNDKYDCLFSRCNQYILAGQCTSKKFAIWDSATLEKLESTSNSYVGTCLKYSDSFQIISPARSSWGCDLSIGVDYFHLPTGEVTLVTNKYLSEPFIWKDRKCVVVLNSTSFLAVYDIINKEIVDMFQIDCLPIDAGIHWISNLDKTNFLVWLSENLVVLLSFAASEILLVSPYVTYAAIKCCTFSPDNEYIACCFENSILTVKSIDNGKALQTVLLKHLPEACWWSELYLWVVCKGVVFKFPYDPTDAEVLENAVKECNMHFDRVLQFAEGVLVMRLNWKISMFKICNEKLCLQQIPDSSFSPKYVLAISSDGCAILLHSTNRSECELWEVVSENKWELRSKISFDHFYNMEEDWFWLTGTLSSRRLECLRNFPTHLSFIDFSNDGHHQLRLPINFEFYNVKGAIRVGLDSLIVLERGWIHFINMSGGKIIATLYLGEISSLSNGNVSMYYLASRAMLFFVVGNDIKYFKIHYIENHLKS